MIALASLLALALAVPASPTQPAEVIESIVVHGNHTTPAADVLALVGDVAGQPASDEIFAGIRERLEKSGRFAGVDVRKRYLSIDDPTRVLVVIVVDEHAGVAEDDLTPGPLKRFGASTMWLRVGAAGALAGLAIVCIWESPFRTPATLMLAAVAAGLASAPEDRG